MEASPEDGLVDKIRKMYNPNILIHLITSSTSDSIGAMHDIHNLCDHWIIRLHITYVETGCCGLPETSRVLVAKRIGIGVDA